MDAEGKRILAAQVLLRWCVQHSPLTEMQVKHMTLAKQRILATFDPQDLDQGYKWFREQLAKAGRKVAR